MRQRLIREGVLRAIDLYSGPAASEVELSLAHYPDYVQKVFEGRLSNREVLRVGFPGSPQLVERSRCSVGSTIWPAGATIQGDLMTTYSRNSRNYIPDLFAPHDEALRRAWEDTPKYGLPGISVRPEEGRFLQIMVRACGARRALEVGTLGGYSGIWIARGLLPGGKLITLEREARHAELARRHFAQAGLAEVVEVREGQALESLKSLLGGEAFDFVFIDADKGNYRAYFEHALQLLRPGGMISAHNALRGGRVFDPEADDETTLLMRDFNQFVAGHPQVISTIYPAGDGTLVAVKTG